MRFKPIKQSRQTEIWYSRQLVSRVKWLREQIERALQNKQSPFFMDSDFDVFNTEQLLSVIKKLSEKDRSNEIESLANEFVSRGNVQNQREVGENLKRQTGIDLQAFLNQNTAVLNKMSVMTTANVQLIKSIEQQYLDKVQTIITQGAISGKLNRDLAKEIRDLGGVTENRAKFIARDQSSKINAALTQARHEELGIKKYRWSTSGDERVRDSHAENDGKIFSYDQPPETGHPGQDFNCRCVAIPVLDDLPTDKEKEPSELSQKTEEILPKELPEVINIGKRLHEKHKELIEEAVLSNNPHESIIKILHKEGVETGGIINTLGIEKRAVSELTEAVGRYPKAWVEKSNLEGKTFVAEKGRRAYHLFVTQDGVNAINNVKRSVAGSPFKRFFNNKQVNVGDSLIVSNTEKDLKGRLSTSVHEYGHRLQQVFPELNEYFQALWEERTKNDRYEMLSALTGNLKYGAEMTKKDHLPHPYYGKVYKDGTNRWAKDQALEMLTMTFQSLLGGERERFLELYESDFELFSLGLSLLVRFKE